MKKTIQYILCFSIVALLFTACQKSDPITPIEQFKLINSAEANSVKDGKLYHHTICVATEGVTVSFDKTTGTYSYSGTGNCFKGTFTCKPVCIEGIIYALSDKANIDQTYTDAEWITVTGGSTSSEIITGGNITIVSDQEDLTVSSVKGNIRVNGIKKGIDFEGAIVFEAEPVLSGYTYTVNITDVYDATYSVVPGVKKYIISVLDPDMAPAGEFDAILPEGTTSILGKYTVASNYPKDPYLMDAGYNFPDWGFSGGTQYVNDYGVKMFVTGGTVEISKTEQGWICIAGNDVDVTDQSGAAGKGTFLIKNMPEVAITIGGGGEDEGTAFPTILESAYNTMSGNIWTTKLVSDGVTGTYDAATWGYVFTGTGYYVSFDLITDGDPGSLPKGTYTAADNGTAAVGNFVKGYNDPYGMGMIWGSAIGVVTDGIKVDEAIIDGTLEVSDTKISFEFITANGTYKGYHNL